MKAVKASESAQKHTYKQIPGMKANKANQSPPYQSILLLKLVEGGKIIVTKSIGVVLFFGRLRKQRKEINLVEVKLLIDFDDYFCSICSSILSNFYTLLLKILRT